MLLSFCLASGDRSRDSSAKEIVSSIFHAANKRIRRSRDKSTGRMRESSSREGTVSEPNSYSERNIDHEIELHRLQELLRTGGTSELVEDANEQTPADGSQDSSAISLTSSTASTETKDVVNVSQSSKTEDLPLRRDCLGSAILKERRAYFMQHGCNRLSTENSDQKRHSVDVSQLTDGVTVQESTTDAAATVSEPLATPVSPSTSRSLGNVMIAVPSSRAEKLQHVAEQHMQQLADDLQRTFNATLLQLSHISPVAPEVSSSVCPPELSSSDTAAKSAAVDSQSVTSDYSTMSSLGGGQEYSRPSRLVSEDVEMTTALQKMSNRPAVGHCRNRNEVPHSTPRSQSSGNFSLSNSEVAEASQCTASAMELSQNSIDSAADHLDQSSLSVSSQMSGSQMSDTDDMVLRTYSTSADKLSFSPVVQPSDTASQKSCAVDSSAVQTAVTQVEQFVEPAVAELMVQTDLHTNSSVGLSVQHDFSATSIDSETNTVLDRPTAAVIPLSSEKQKSSEVQGGDIPCMDKVVAGSDRDNRFEQNTDCNDGAAVSKVVPSASSDRKAISTSWMKEQFVQSQHPVCRLVRRHTLGGTGDLAIPIIDPKSESPLSVQSAFSPNEQRLSAWQRLQPAVKDELPNFGMWLATQRQLHHVRSSPALFVGVGLSPASCLYSSQSCQPVV